MVKKLQCCFTEYPASTLPQRCRRRAAERARCYRAHRRLSLAKAGRDTFSLRRHLRSRERMRLAGGACAKSLVRLLRRRWCRRGFRRGMRTGIAHHPRGEILADETVAFIRAAEM